MNRRIFLSLLSAAAVVPNMLLTSAAKARASRLPVIFGRVLNVAPALVDPERLIYQIHDGRVDSIDAIRDGGIALIIDGDCGSISEFRRATILPGHARTCVRYGLIRLGSAPFFPVTVDAVGEKLHPSVIRDDELCGAVRYGSHSREWLAEIDRQGLLVRTWGPA